MGTGPTVVFTRKQFNDALKFLLNQQGSFI